MASKIQNQVKRAVAHLDSPQPKTNSTAVAITTDDLKAVRNSVLPTNIDRQIWQIAQKRKIETKFGDTDVNEIALMINRVSYFLGLREPLEKGALRLQAEFLQANFPDETPSTFHHAFQLAAAQKLNCKTDFFGVWTPQYMGRILNAYKAWMGDVEIKVRQAEQQLYDEREVKIKSEMFDMQVALSKMICDAHNEWQTIHAEKKPEYGWVFIWQLRHIAETIKKYTLLNPDIILGEPWKKNNDESTVELFRRIFSDVNPDGKKTLSQDFWQKWLNEFYTESK
jgi:hypothetical protein